MRLIIDTNIILAITPKKSEERWLYELLRKGEVSLIISNEIMSEYEEKLSWYYSEYFAEIVLEEILNFHKTEQYEAYYKWQLIEVDKDDNKFVDVAIASNAEFIITNDRHYNALKLIKFPKVNVLKLNELKDLLLNMGVI